MKNKYAYQLEMLNTGKIVTIKEILGPKKVAKVVTKGRQSYGESRLERSQLEEVEDYSYVDITKHQISDISSLGKALLKHEKEASDKKTIDCVNDDGTRVSYAIMSKSLLKT